MDEIRQEPGKFYPVKLRFGVPFRCEEHEVPLVVVEQKLMAKGAGNRLWLICPICATGIKVIVQQAFTDVDMRPHMPSGSCIFDPTPHNCNGQNCGDLAGERDEDGDVIEMDEEGEECDCDECRDDVLREHKRVEEEIERREAKKKSARKRRRRR